MYCKYCGANIPDGSAFCKECGGKQTTDEPAAVPQQQMYTSVQQPYAPPKKNISLIVAVCVLGVLAAAALVFVGIKLFGAPKNNADAFADVYEELIASSDIGSADAEDVPEATETPAEMPTEAPAQAPTEAPTEASTQAPEQSGGSSELDAIVAAGFEPDIEGYLDQTWWASTGHEIANSYAQAVASGYPVTYDLEYGEVQYIFDAETQTVTAIYEDADGYLEEREWDYILDPEGFYLYAFYRTVNIDGIDHEIKSVFFVSEGVLYELEVMDDLDEVSNIIELEIYGP